MSIAALTALALLATAGCAAQSGGNGATVSSVTSAAPLPQSHPQVVQPVAGAAARIDPASAPATAGVSVDTPGTSQSLPEPQSVSDIRKELAQSGMTASTNQATLTPDGLAVAPPARPPRSRR
jgi:hypothetical protein